MIMNVLRVSDINKSFGELEVIRSISFEVNKGEVVAIIGPSGSGKSTLLRCLTLLEQVDGGSIEYLSRKMVHTPESGNPVYAAGADLRTIRKCFGLVFQKFNLFPHLSVMHNITQAPIHVLKLSKAEAEARAENLLHKMGLWEKASAYPYQLSGGQQQRIAIARAMALEPEILYFDEPTSALDPELTGEILRTIRDLAAEHNTMVIVTHEMSFARDVADKIIFMDGGVIVEQGTPSEVLENPGNKRTRTFLGMKD